ncbi:hypothetical protein C8F04DRAFT_1213983 [Mycena alexandri]|uniref:Transposase n=1 Tax=Mycena alexandri TaxID=1745969 RepID=A0AAD6WTW2_9AGAR|nr:hypothetical protein C8F04DRAFT_1213983 [Mycena alexandri]
MAQLRENRRPELPQLQNTTPDFRVDWGAMDFDTQLDEPHEVRMTAQLAQNFEDYLRDPDLNFDSDEEGDERSQINDSSESGYGETQSPWFPWPDKETCVLDILRHIPRCSFSKKQNTAIHWAMLALGIKDLPSDRIMDDIDKGLQKMCGIQSIRYSGKLGHIYYVNDLAAIIAQEMANPTTRQNLHFLPEDSRPSLSQAWQASRWLDELEADLTTPMVRVNTQDFYINEPTILSNGTVCMPIRWFKRGDKIFARAWKMRQTSAVDPNEGWIVEADHEFEVKQSDLLVSFPLFSQTYLDRKASDPTVIYGIEKAGEIKKWTHTKPKEGNRWRNLSTGHRVLAFPIWLYCDDTSGNTSKKWNKHNSFLFTAAGLPRKFVHRESNIHFLSTSNVAPPLEMLDGIVDQLEECQKHGIWAWDAVHRELVLVIPSVLAMLGDNPMQSEFACHIGFRGKYFCRVCWVKGEPEADENEADSDGSDASTLSDDGKKKKKKKKNESVSDMISRVTQFMTRGRPRFRTETRAELKSQFTVASSVGGQAGFKRKKTDSGIKDTFQGVFLDRIFSVSTKRGVKKTEKQAAVNALLRTFPPDITSPVWRIRDFNPHQDTPVEILHVILLGFVKYFWRDAVARVKNSDKEILISRLSSFNICGLGISPLPGHTLVNYSGSLTGRDFRTIVQAAPFVLQGLLPAPYIELWTALSAVVTLVWQPEILDLDKHTHQLDAAIKHFLDCTCRITLQWFNKPKFHVILHLPAHIRRFGPAMLFATEGFESFNAIIRSCSVHSNRHAPSLDIASKMARGNRVRHLLSRGFFPADEVFDLLPGDRSSKSPWMGIPLKKLEERRWCQAGQAPLKFMELNSFGSRLLNQYFLSKLCPANDWVVWVDSFGRSRIGRVIEIIQVAGSPAQQSGAADFVLVSRTIIGEAHDIYKMRRLQPVADEFIHVQLKDIKCTVNIQHNCADNKCRTTRTRVIYNEREETSQRALNVEHFFESDLIVNTAQMRDAALLDDFHRQKAGQNTTAPQIQGEAIGDPAAEPARKRTRTTLTRVQTVPQPSSGLRHVLASSGSPNGPSNIQFENAFQATFESQ